MLVLKVNSKKIPRLTLKSLFLDRSFRHAARVVMRVQALLFRVLAVSRTPPPEALQVLDPFCPLRRVSSSNLACVVMGVKATILGKDAKPVAVPVEAFEMPV